MPVFHYIVNVEAANKSHAETVIHERIGPDEDYGFEYAIWIEGFVGTDDDEYTEQRQAGLSEGF